MRDVLFFIKAYILIVTPMKASALKYFVISLLASLVSLIIILMPFHAFLTVYASSSIIGHYTLLRLWKEMLLLLCLIGSLYLVFADSKIRSHTLTRRLIQVILLYTVWAGLWGLYALCYHSVTHKALAYGLLIDLRFITFFLVAWAIALRTKQLPAQWQRLLLWPAYGVIAFGLLQVLVLPTDFLRHFGYNPDTTITPVETINHNINYIRIASTLRGPNPLGAYLIVPISLLAVYVFTPIRRNRSHFLILAAALTTLYFSYSRSAYIGAAVAIAIVVALAARKYMSRKIIIAGLLGLILVAGGTIMLRHNAHFQNVVYHTEDKSKVSISSNQGHVAAFKAGIGDVVHHPLGSGPGTAGPASFYNNGKARIAENYYVQVGQELGWIGIGLFLLIIAGVGYLLWVRRADPLALSLFASLAGISIVNMLSHAWADDTLAYVWWGLAGIAMAQPAIKHAQIAEPSKLTTKNAPKTAK